MRHIRREKAILQDAAGMPEELAYYMVVQIWGVPEKDHPIIYLRL